MLNFIIAGLYAYTITKAVSDGIDHQYKHVKAKQRHAKKTVKKKKNEDDKIFDEVSC